MNNHEAKQVILEADSCFCKHGAYKDCHSGCKYRDALDAAVKALEQESKTGYWIEEFNDLEGEVRFTCSCCGKYQLFGTDFCYNCGAKMIEPQESEVDNG